MQMWAKDLNELKCITIQTVSKTHCSGDRRDHKPHKDKHSGCNYLHFLGCIMILLSCSAQRTKPYIGLNRDERNHLSHNYLWNMKVLGWNKSCRLKSESNDLFQIDPKNKSLKQKNHFNSAMKHNCSSMYKHQKLSASMANMHFLFSSILWILSDML